MRTVGVFSAIIATWQATAINVQTIFGAMPESMGMLLWGVCLLTLAGAARHRSSKELHVERRPESASQTPMSVRLGVARGLIDGGCQDTPCASVQ